MTEWQDPFGEDEAARDRARRRAERARRREEREAGEEAEDARASLAPRVGERPADAAPTAAGPGDGHPAGDGASPPAVADGNGAGAPVALDRPPPPPGRPPRAAPPPSAPRRPPGGPSPGAVRVRRLVAVLGVACLAFVALVVFVLARSGDDEEAAPAPAPAKPLKTIDITIPEGYDRTQTAAVAKDAGIDGNYAKASARASGFPLARHGAQGADSLEGFLFPATYELYKRDDVEDLVDKQLDAFQQNIATVDMGYARSRNLTTYDVVKIASMIEREVQVPRERKLVAAVIYNRLSQGMNLAIDATIRFEDRNYDEPLLESRLQEDTPYNTYVNPGLPPGPIGNPGLASLRAAAKPAKVDHLYYVVKPGTCGEHVFVDTEEEFYAASARYDAAREAAGGKSPTEC
jgi:YceG-like family